MDKSIQQLDKSLQSLEQARASALDMGIRFGPKLMVAIIIPVPQYEVRMVGAGA